MSTTTRTRIINPRLGSYFGIFASAFAGLVLVLLILEQLGVSDTLLRGLMMSAPLALYAIIGLGARTKEVQDFFASGRRVPAVYNGLIMAVGAIGGTGLAAISGLFFLHGFDGWCVPIGITAGFVVMAPLLAPFLRKFGAYTVPSYLGRRFDNRPIRMTAAALLAVPALLILAAEIRTGTIAGVWLTGQPEGLVAFALVLAVGAALVLGGMRSLSWANTSECIAALLALLVPAALIGVAMTNLPLPQLSSGPILRALSRLEAIQKIPLPLSSLLTFDFAGVAPASVSQRFAQPFGSLGPLSFILTSLTVMTGIASAPWLLARVGTTPGIYETRKSLGWATFFVGMVMTTLAANAIFLRDIVMHALVGQTRAQLPAWFQTLEAAGLAAVNAQVPQLPLSSFTFARDGVLIALPVSQSYPAVMIYLVLAGIIAAVVATSSLAAMALGASLAEDIVHGLRREPPSGGVRLGVARGAILGAAALGGWLATSTTADPLALFFWALALSASAFFPVLVLSIWWKRLNKLGAIAGMVTGFAVAALAIVDGNVSWLGVNSALAAVFGIPASFAAAAVGSWFGGRPGRQAIELVSDMRIPGGETMHDREVRLLRLKQRQRF
jgi:cation/acetate symporter